MKYLALSFGERVGFVYHLPLRALGISLLRFVTEDDPSLTLHKKALQPLSLRREPTQKSCFPRPKNVFVQQTWFIFYGRALPCQPAVCFFPFSLAVIQGQAYYCYCDLLFSVEWVGRNHLYLTVFFARETVNCRSFSYTLLGLYPNAQLSRITAWDLRQLS